MTFDVLDSGKYVRTNMLCEALQVGGLSLSLSFSFMNMFWMKNKV